MAIACATTQVPKVRMKLSLVYLALKQLVRLLQHALEIARCVDVSGDEPSDRTIYERLWWRRRRG